MGLGACPLALPSVRLECPALWLQHRWPASILRIMNRRQGVTGHQDLAGLLHL